MSSPQQAGPGSSTLELGTARSTTSRRPAPPDRRTTLNPVPYRRQLSTMATTISAEQTEKAFQKQPIFQNSKIKSAGKKVASKDRRWYKDVGLGFKTPAEAINGTYIDKKCPFTGEVSIRGRILTGVVVSTKMTRTIIIRREYLHYIPKYSRYEKRHQNMAVHCSPAFRVEIGDQVTVGQCDLYRRVQKSKSSALAKQFGKF
ncbi:hypothetical protein PGT21_000472 [Puccinia graminis f. sp. tritici]|uniref:Small ribosomal subunit protein uS17 n=1 Tax=Puccinia graminis f. sp. tritici TaxID=56615 RepID=A0A5B0N7Y3_PUCGR|nr:hypothetical protein PGT21_000472 [Puccinia graminis f. sp. tritici]